LSYDQEDQFIPIRKPSEEYRPQERFNVYDAVAAVNAV